MRSRLSSPLLRILGRLTSIQTSGIKEPGQERSFHLGSCPYTLALPDLSEHTLTDREGLSVPAALMERKPMKYGPSELQARLAFLFTLLYTSSHPVAVKKQHKTKQNKITKYNKTIKLSTEWSLGWLLRGKGNCTLKVQLLPPQPCPRLRVRLGEEAGGEDLSRWHQPEAQKVEA